jgi:pimeloyl-ACP methyl ester carboxylesterase
VRWKDRVVPDLVELHLEVDGPENGPPVLFLHGITGSARTWAWLPDDLTAGRRVARLDFRGHGRSGRTPGTYTLAHYGADVVRVLEELGPRPAVLVGHSLGGVVAWWTAQRRPDLVGAAFLEDPPLFTGDPSSPRAARVMALFELRRAEALAYQAVGLSEDEAAGKLGALVWGPPGSPTFREIAHDDAVAAMSFGHLRMDVGVLDAALDGTALVGTDTTSPVTRPVTILAADDAFGAAFTSADGERLARTQPSVVVIGVGGCGHGIHDDRRHRETFAGHLRRFLDEHAPPV